MATPSNTDKDVQSKLRALVNMLLEYLNEINNPLEMQDSENVDGEAIINALGKLGIILADNATKVTIACKPPCTPTSAIPTIEAMGETLFRISGFVTSTPTSMGKTLTQMIRSTAREILLGSAVLANSFLDEPLDPSILTSKGHLISTGIVWEACDRFKNLPKSNRQAVIIKWKEMLDLLKDAILEIKKLLDQDDEQGEEDDGWGEIFGDETLSANEKEIVELSLKLFNLEKFLFNKILKRYIEPLDIITPNSSSEEGKSDESVSLIKINKTLDQYLNLGKLIFDAIDELGTNLYPPQDSIAIESKVNDIYLHSQELIKMILLCASQEDIELLNSCDAHFTKILQSIVKNENK